MTRNYLAVTIKNHLIYKMLKLAVFVALSLFVCVALCEKEPEVTDTVYFDVSKHFYDP